jgi:hypothetical protein
MEEIIALAESFNKISQLTNDQLSNLDNQVNDLYHQLELGNHNAIGLVKLASDLRKILKERRREKQKLSVIHSIRDTPHHKPFNIEKLKTIGNILPTKKQKDTK